MHRALELPTQVDLSALSYFLYQQGLPHKITEESGKQVIWTPDSELGVVVQRVYEEWQSGQLELNEAPPRKGPELSRVLKKIPWKRFPFTLLLLVVCLMVAIFTQLGADYQAVSLLSFVKFQVANGYIYFTSLTHTLDTHEYWRLITPIFVHFGMMHLAFNAVMFYVLGKRIEYYQGGIHLLGLVLISGALSNFAQYYTSDGTSLFGGLSGVVYALLGYGLAREKMDKSFSMGLPPAIYGFMIFWLIIGYTDILGSLVGHMANAAHLGGLLSGIVLGALAGLLFKRREAS